MSISNLANKLIQVFFPYRCILCHLKSDQKHDLCRECELDLPWIKNGCQRCALELQGNLLGEVCGACLSSPPPYEKLVALFQYTQPLISLIKQLKFDNKLIFAYVLGNLLCQHISKLYLPLQLPQLITPIPLHKKRLQERGFNQSLEIARVLGKRLDIAINTKNITRDEYTLAQSSLTREERMNNIKNCFRINNIFDASYVAVIDDVMTTGNTMNEFCFTLRKAGVKKIDVWCIARTQV